MENKHNELTRGEEEIMQILWRIGSGYVNDIIAEIDGPKPKYTTVATFIKILENKGFAAHQAHGKSHCYYPVVTREEYAQGRMKRMLSSYFSQHEELPMEEMDEILEIMERAKKQEQP